MTRFRNAEISTGRGVIFDLGGTLVYNHPDPWLDRERRQCGAIAAFAAHELGCREAGELGARLLALRDEGGRLAEQDLVERLARDTVSTALREAGMPVNDEILDRAERLPFDSDRNQPFYLGATRAPPRPSGPRPADRADQQLVQSLDRHRCRGRGRHSRLFLAARLLRELRPYQAASGNLPACAHGFNLEPQVRRTLVDLGLPEALWPLSADALSGGEQTHLNLARVLIVAPDFLLLDEPTNHLDLAAIEWLENFVAAFRGAIIVAPMTAVFST